MPDDHFETNFFCFQWLDPMDLALGDMDQRDTCLTALRFQMFTVDIISMVFMDKSNSTWQKLHHCPLYCFHNLYLKINFELLLTMAQVITEDNWLTDEPQSAVNCSVTCSVVPSVTSVTTIKYTERNKMVIYLPITGTKAGQVRLKLGNRLNWVTFGNAAFWLKLHWSRSNQDKFTTKTTGSLWTELI